MEKSSKINVYLMTKIALVTAVLCILGPLSIPIPISPVPITLSNLVIFISVFVLEWKAATISVVLYLLLGTVGLPVFSGFSGGVAKLLGPTGGYLVGFIFLVAIAGIFTDHFKGKRWYLFYLTGVILGEIVLYLLGTFWLSYSMSITFYEALFLAVIPYLPADGVKIVIAMVLGFKMRGLKYRFR